MSDNYTPAAEEAQQFFVRVSTESDALNAKIIEYSNRMGRITRQGNPAEWDAIIRESAADLQIYAQQIDGLFPDYRRNVELLTKGYAEKVESLDPAIGDGAQELEAMRRAAQGLAETASEVKPKITALRSILGTIRDANYDHRMTQAAHRVISTADSLLAAYEDLETFALKVSFSADQK
jgi:acyl transferase domain-containing protein